jgi:MSHA biogenesis protein MshJ
MIADRLQQLRKRFDALQTRERLLVIATGVALIWAVAQPLYFNSAEQRAKQLRAEAAEARQQITALEARETVLKAQLLDGGLAALHAKVEELKRRRAQLDQELQQQGVKLLDPARMREVLHELLQGSGLRLKALRRLPVEVAFTTQPQPGPADKGKDSTQPNAPASPALPGEGPGVTLYRHALQIEIDGRYGEMVSYLERLEASGWRLMWQSLDIETLDYPLARMRLTVYTLSLQKEWLGV